MKRLILLTTFSCLSLLVSAQNTQDLFRYSQYNVIGNARFNAMSGAFGAIGANFSAVATNPASMGLYSKSEITFTPALDFYTNFADYNGTSRQASNTRFMIPNFGIVGLLYDGSKLAGSWVSVQLGFGVNRTGDYNDLTVMQGFNANNSLMDVFISNANGKNPSRLDPMYEDLAYRAYLLDPTDTINWRYTSVTSGGKFTQRKVLESTGSNTEMNFTVSGNYNNTIYIGATIGVPIIAYDQRIEYTESNTENRPLYRPFKSYTFSERVRTSGAGINLKLGLIYRPFDFFRVGLAFHTPTYLSLNERFSTQIKTDMIVVEDDLYDGIVGPVDGRYNYRITTPLRAMASLGFIIGKVGLVGIDAEYVDYRMMKFGGTDEYLDMQNMSVKEEFKPCMNVKLGTEWRVFPLSLRGGFAYSGNPYAYATDQTWSKWSYSLGLGITSGRMTYDLAFSQQIGKSNYYMYDYVNSSGNSLVNPVYIRQNKYVVSFTLGVKF